MRDNHNDTKLARSISSVSVSDNTAQVGQIVDAAGFDALEYELNVGASGAAAATFTVLLEHGDLSGGSDMVPVPDADLFGTEAAASWTGSGGSSNGANTQRKLGYKGIKRYTRLTVTPASNNSACVFGAIARLGMAKKTPQSAQVT